MTRGRRHINRAKVRDMAFVIGEQAATLARAEVPRAEVTEEQARFLVELSRFNATKNLPRSSAQKLIRRQQAKRIETRAHELFPGMATEIV